MNATFTIESVHGIKQTVVLMPRGTVDPTVRGTDKSSEQDRQEQRDDGPSRSR
jgi:hypothetical protein